MRREDVDPDRNKCCSRGLHVASWEYAATYMGEVLIEVQVNPKDVVAVPLDYNFGKMRTCRYRVVRVISEPNPNSIEIDDFVQES